MFSSHRSLSNRISRAALLLTLAVVAGAQENRLPSELEGVGVDEKFGQKVNLDLEL